MLVACNSGPATVILPPLEAMVAGGDGQYGTPGQTLQTPLHVIVRTVSTQLPRSGMNVSWSVESGDASIVGVPNVVTDSAGSATTRIRLGVATGEVRVRATVVDQEHTTATFGLFIVDRPELDGIAPAGATPGQTVTLTGANFSPDATQNVVLFGGVRGRVTDASPVQLSVEVPPCLPERNVQVTVQLGVVASGARTLAVSSGGSVHPMLVGETVDLTDDEGYGCVTLPGDGAESYLAIVHSASTLGAASHAFELTGIAATFPLAQSPSVTLPTETQSSIGQPDPQALLDERLRGLERTLTRGRRAAASGSSRAAGEAPAAIPAVGERRTFQVFRNAGGFTEVTAVAQYVGAQAVFFVDEEAPSGGYTTVDLQQFSERFDEAIHPTVTAVFGVASDLDSNERVTILLTPAVNSLTPRGATGFVGGFFFGLDLLPEEEGSNAAEIFYSLVPDPAGLFSDPRPKSSLLEITPAILAHEFQHMVHFNERVLVREAEANEALWLSEGLAQYAEELVSRAYDGQSDVVSAEIFRDGVRDRARRYLAHPDTVALIVSTGRGNLSERGAGFLNLLYLTDRFGDEVAGRLTRTTRTGVANVEAETGTQWADLLSDWWSALYMDGAGPESGSRVFPRLDLRDYLGDPFPLVPTDLGSGDFLRAGLLRSSSAGYYLVSPSSVAGGTTTVRLGGEAGGLRLPGAALRVRIIRVW
jgi:hypothetical protein